MTHGDLAGRHVPSRVLIVGFGNSLAGDDAAGPEVVRRLLARPLPSGVRAEDGGSDSLRLPTVWRGEGEVWLVDALIGGGPAGTVHRLDHERLLAVPQRHATVHHLSLPESIRWIALAFPAMGSVRYRLWGIEPREVRLGEPLSPAVADAVECVANELWREAVAHTRDPSPDPATTHP